MLAGIALLCGVEGGSRWCGLGLALSSTAIALGVLGRAQSAGHPTSGQSVVSVALLQDVAAIQLPRCCRCRTMTEHDDGSGWIGDAKAIGVIIAIILGGRMLLRPALRLIARSETPRIFTAARCCSSSRPLR